MKNKTLKLLIVISCLLNTSLKAQVSPLWTQTINSFPDTALISPVRTLIDQLGNVVALSTYRKNVGGNNHFKVVLNKYNSNGTHLWNYVFDNGGNGDPMGWDMALDNQGNIGVAGAYMSAPNYKPFIILVSSSGNLSWQRDTTTSFVVGNYSKIISLFNRFYLSNSSGIAVYSYNGTELWSNTTIPSCIAVDKNGDLIATSYIATTTSLVRFDSLGNQNLSDSAFLAERIITDDNRNIYLFAQYPGYVLVKIDSNGVFQWMHDTFPATPPFGDISFDVLVDFNQDIVVLGLNDTMFKFSPSGQIIWKRSMGGLDQYKSISQVFYYNLIFVAGVQSGPGGYDISVSAFNLFGFPCWTGSYSSNSTQEFSVDLAINTDGVYILEDSISNSNLIKFQSPIFQGIFDFNNFCVDSVWYDAINPNVINVSVLNGGASSLNYPSVRIVSPAGDTISNVYNLVNFFAHLPNSIQTYSDTITVNGINDFSGYHFIMYDSFGATFGEIPLCITLSVDEKDVESIIFYPNPASNRLVVSNLSLSEKYSISLFDVQGRLMLNEKSVGETSHAVAVDEFPQGLYILQVGSEKGIKTFRVVKED